MAVAAVSTLPSHGTSFLSQPRLPGLQLNGPRERQATAGPRAEGRDLLRCSRAGSSTMDEAAAPKGHPILPDLCPPLAVDLCLSLWKAENAAIIHGFLSLLTISGRKFRH